jgi:hypothetical protein
MTDEFDEEEADVLSGEVKLPAVFKKHQLGVSQTKQGSKDLVRFAVWNVITPCRQEECPIYDDCPYEDRKKKGGKCRVEQGYVNSIGDMVYRNFKGVFSEDQFFIVGMHVLPLYRHLCRLKIWEWSVREVMYEDDKGRRHLNPIYREIREQIKTISAQWRGLGVGQFQIVEPKNPWGSSGKPLVDDRNKSYYDRMGEIEPASDTPFNREKKVLRMRAK